MALLIMKRSGLGAGIREERIEKAKNIKDSVSIATERLGALLVLPATWGIPKDLKASLCSRVNASAHSLGIGTQRHQEARHPRLAGCE